MVFRANAIKMRRLFKQLEQRETDMAPNTILEIKFSKAGNSLKPCLAFINDEGKTVCLAPIELKDLKRWKKDLTEMRSLRSGNGTPLASLPKSQRE